MSEHSSPNGRNLLVAGTGNVQDEPGNEEMLQDDRREKGTWPPPTQPQTQSSASKEVVLECNRRVHTGVRDLALECGEDTTPVQMGPHRRWSKRPTLLVWAPHSNVLPEDTAWNTWGSRTDHHPQRPQIPGAPGHSGSCWLQAPML